MCSGSLGSQSFAVVGFITPGCVCMRMCVCFVFAGPEEYHYVNQGDCFELRQVEDEDEFEKTKNALSVRAYLDHRGGSAHHIVDSKVVVFTLFQISIHIRKLLRP